MGLAWAPKRQEELLFPLYYCTDYNCEIVNKDVFKTLQIKQSKSFEHIVYILLKSTCESASINLDESGQLETSFRMQAKTSEGKKNPESLASIKKINK